MVSQVFRCRRFQVLILSLALLQALGEVGEVRRQSHLDQWDNNMGFPTMGSNGITFIKHMGYRARWDNWVDINRISRESLTTMDVHILRYETFPRSVRLVDPSNFQTTNSRAKRDFMSFSVIPRKLWESWAGTCAT